MSFKTSHVFTFFSFEHIHLSPEKMAVIRKFFNGRETVEIPVVRVLLNSGYGGFGLSEEVLIRYNNTRSKRT